MDYKLVLAILVLCVGLGGCDSTDSGGDDREIVVESYLIANEPLNQVRLSRSSSVNQAYDFTASAISNANVTVSLLTEDGSSAERVFDFVTNSEEPGIYKPAIPHRVVPGRQYRLDVDLPGTLDEVTSTTLVPGAFELLQANATIIEYQSDEQLELELTRSITPGRQSVFVFATESLQPTIDLLTPFYRDLIGDDEDDLEDLRITESPIINEANYEVNENGTITVKLPWLAVAFFGPNRLTANALDDNMFDFIRSQTVQQGGSTLAPGEIPNVIDRVEGGTGIFGSLSRSSYEVLITR